MRNRNIAEYQKLTKKVGPSDAIPVIFRNSGTVSMNEPLEATGNVGL